MTAIVSGWIAGRGLSWRLNSDIYSYSIHMDAVPCARERATVKAGLDGRCSEILFLAKLKSAAVAARLCNRRMLHAGASALHSATCEVARPARCRGCRPRALGRSLGLRGQRLRYFSFGSVFASSAAMMWYPGVFMWMLKVPSQKYVKLQTLATGTGI
jgi:hypothetical protein